METVGIKVIQSIIEIQTVKQVGKLKGLDKIRWQNHYNKQEIVVAVIIQIFKNNLFLSFGH